MNRRRCKACVARQSFVSGGNIVPILKIRPGQTVNLKDVDPDDTGDVVKKKEAQKQLAQQVARIAALQNILFAQGKHALLIILQAIDAGGKDGTIRNVFSGVNPQGVRVTGFGKPTEEELEHDFLWRIHKAVPKQGMIGVFNRSHYEDVLVARVKSLAPEPVWRGRYAHINHFEKLLANKGTTILKFYLHISKAEQKERLQARLDDPNKHWKFNPADLAERARWEDYMRAFEDALTHCSTEHAPWYIVPANRKWYRNLAVAETIVQTLEGLNLQYPPSAEGLEKIQIAD
jgi:PPK2 family polyphosphate:nucleotide phosphotransferase